MADERPPRPSRRFARRARHLAVIAAMLGLVGGTYALFMPHAAVAQAQDPALIREGQGLYDTSCITCHGSNLQGIPNRAELGASPGVVTPRAGEDRAQRKGAAAVHFTLVRSAPPVSVCRGVRRTRQEDRPGVG